MTFQRLNPILGFFHVPSAVRRGPAKSLISRHDTTVPRASTRHERDKNRGGRSLFVRVPAAPHRPSGRPARHTQQASPGMKCVASYIPCVYKQSP
jgi:hypothetical protein